MNNYKLYLGIIDNLHDFYKHNVYKNNKSDCEMLFDKLFFFIKIKYLNNINKLTENIITNYKKEKINSNKLLNFKDNLKKKLLILANQYKLLY